MTNIKRKVDTFLIGSAIAASVLGGTSCVRRAGRHAAVEKARQEASADSIKRANEKRFQEKNAFEEHAADSIRSVNGYAEYEKELKSLPESYKDMNKIDSILYSKTLGGVMEKEVIKSCGAIAREYVEQINDLFEKYSSLPQPSFNDDYLVINLLEDALNDNAKEAGFFDHYTFSFNHDLNQYVEHSKYGMERKNEIKQKIENIFQNTKKKLLAIKKDVEKRYADYYIVSDVKELGIDADDERGNWWFGYSDLNNEYINPKVLVTKKSVSVYDQKLPVVFFGEKDAKYKLVSVGTNKWQVFKTYKNGAMGKTKVFEDKKDFSTRSYPINEDKVAVKVGDSEFSFSAGQNKGVHVNYTEVTKVQKRKKDWEPKYTPAEQEMLDSLTNQIETKERLERLSDSASVAAIIQASELAERRYKK